MQWPQYTPPQERGLKEHWDRRAIIRLVLSGFLKSAATLMSDVTQSAHKDERRWSEENSQGVTSGPWFDNAMGDC